jgi:hypothetical protein
MNRTVVEARLAVAALASPGGEVDSGPSISGARLMNDSTTPGSLAVAL